VAVFGHIHRAFIRRIGGLTVINTGSVSLSYDGDPRAAYLLLDDGVPYIRRVDYNVDHEARQMVARRMPYADWVTAMLRTASAQMPS
jgi:predicted phosphodiesterase